ncbi:hypothetical protein BDD12DRAFT_360593 [Trichophaea hybrida]|nr:hypothetical protein BDD12DRAFT_360593 [Trichophaea hybrida]
MSSKTAHIGVTNAASQKLFFPTTSPAGRKLPSDISTTHNEPESPTSANFPPTPITPISMASWLSCHCWITAALTTPRVSPVVRPTLRTESPGPITTGCPSVV